MARFGHSVGNLHTLALLLILSFVILAALMGESNDSPFSSNTQMDPVGI